MMTTKQSHDDRFSDSEEPIDDTRAVMECMVEVAVRIGKSLADAVRQAKIGAHKTAIAQMSATLAETMADIHDMAARLDRVERWLTEGRGSRADR